MIDKKISSKTVPLNLIYFHHYLDNLQFLVENLSQHEVPNNSMKNS